MNEQQQFQAEIEMKTQNLEVFHTGGNCLAYRIDLGNGFYALLTDGDGNGLPAKPDTFYIGLYDDEGNWDEANDFAGAWDELQTCVDTLCAMYNIKAPTIPNNPI